MSLSHQNIVKHNRYSVISALGVGIAGSVYKVIDRERGGEEIALKILDNEGAFDEHTLERFFREYEVGKKMDHPNLIKAYDRLKIGDAHAFTMELAKGVSLESYISDTEQLDLTSIFSQILSALVYMHSVTGCAHRDLKLENVMYCKQSDTVKIIDFGLNKDFTSEKLTADDILLGTVQYMPPEYIESALHTYTPQGDIYVVGLMLLELLTNERWCSEFEGVKALTHRRNTGYSIDSSCFTDVCPKYASIVCKALQPTLEDRYSTASEMLEDLALAPSEFERKEFCVKPRSKVQSRRGQSNLMYLSMAVVLGFLMIILISYFLA